LTKTKNITRTRTDEEDDNSVEEERHEVVHGGKDFIVQETGEHPLTGVEDEHDPFEEEGSHSDCKTFCIEIHRTVKRQKYTQAKHTVSPTRIR
jgi:hypothetical protein